MANFINFYLVVENFERNNAVKRNELWSERCGEKG